MPRAPRPRRHGRSSDRAETASRRSARPGRPRTRSFRHGRSGSAPASPAGRSSLRRRGRRARRGSTRSGAVPEPQPDLRRSLAPGQRAMSGVCIGTSSTKWEKTAAASTADASRRSRRGIRPDASQNSTSRHHRPDERAGEAVGIGHPVEVVGVVAVKPRTMRSFSIPRKTKIAKSTSRSCTARKRSPSGSLGRARFAANATP